jgi:hypothetical protein
VWVKDFEVAPASLRFRQKNHRNYLIDWQQGEKEKIKHPHKLPRAWP